VTRDAPDNQESQAPADEKTRLVPAEPSAMTDAVLATAVVSPVPAQAFRALAAPMAQDIIARIRAEVPAFDDGNEHSHCKLLPMAVRAGVEAFLTGSGSRESEQRKVDELFRRLGHGEALHGNDIEPLLAGIRIAVRCAWEHLADFAVSQQHSAASLRDVASSLLTYADHLRDTLADGYDIGHRYTYNSRDAARNRLFDLFGHAYDGKGSLLEPVGIDQDQLRRMAVEAEWPVPVRVVALAVTFHGNPPSLPESLEVLSRVEADRLVVLCPEKDCGALVSLIERSGPDRRVAISWPVPPAEAASALRWTSRALDLVSLGVIPPARLVRCAEHVTQLWLCAEPSMRERLCQELLEPLLAETPNSREIISDTLLAWLETRDSAPAIAARLGVHPQTVRYRWKRIHDLFGDALQDPEFVLLATMVLKTTVLLWKAGDEGDFERHRDGKPADQ
jgi:hypothetical protein